MRTARGLIRSEKWKRKSPASCDAGLFVWKMPAMTYFRAGSTIIGPKCLTAVFGMGTGVTIWVSSPASCLNISNNLGGKKSRSVNTSEKENNVAKRSTVSTGSLSALLHLYIRPIDLVVFEESSCVET